MVFQGNLLDLNWDTLYFYNNTLQAIAVGYLGAVVIMQLDNIKKQILVTLALLILYWLLLHFAGTGNLTANSNLAGEIDTLIFNTHRDGQEYTWLLSSVNFIVTVMLGAFCGKVLMQDKDNIKKLLQLVYFAMTCLALGYLLSFQDPIIKKIWTSSFTLISGGYCILLLAVFYCIIDVLKFTRWSYLFLVLGSNAIFLYTIFAFNRFINTKDIAQKIVYGVEQYTSNYYPFILSVSSVTLVWLIVYVMYKNKIFIKI